MSQTRPLETASGRRRHSVLQMAVAVKVGVVVSVPLCVRPSTISTSGVVESPNYPGKYPHNLDLTESIQAENGKLLKIEFTYFGVYADWMCRPQYDYVKITDGDGTLLMDRSCGYSTTSASSWNYFLPPIITSLSNTINILFHTDGYRNHTGWSLNWTAVEPGQR